MEFTATGIKSLFSLELLVESARVEPRLLPAPLPANGPFRPAVALRLLDFPTLLVRAPHASSGPLVPFGRGKSCLFKLRPDTLKGLLRRSPLYALLLALPPTPGPARLLGSSSISLAAAAEELLLGTGPGGRRGRFPLRDLMGEPVGELELSYRLGNLGSTLQGHLGQGAAPDEPHAEEEQQSQQLPHRLGNQSFRGISLELIPEAEEEQDPAPEGGSLGSSSDTHTEFLNDNSGLGEIAKELEMETNIFCPPPMYYSCPSGNPQPTPKSTASVIVAPAQQPLPVEETVLPSVVPPVQGEPPRSIQETTQNSQTFGSPEQLRQTLNQLPLLNALLMELSLLNNHQVLQPQPSTVHPQLAWLYQNVEGTKAPSFKHLKCFENSPPRRRLTYGLTNTLRLRLQRSNPAMLKVHEKRELRRKKGEIAVEKKGKSSSAKGKLFRDSPEHLPKTPGHFVEKSIPDQNAQINENVETLIQSSIDQDRPTNVKEVISVAQKKFAASAVKSGDNAEQKGSSEMIGSAYKEKSLKVHLPRVFLQDTDAIENKIYSKVEKCLQHEDCDTSAAQNDSQKSNNFESRLELKNSDGVVASSENTAYSEDFTGVDSSGTSLEAQESSPEPLLASPDQSQSATDSDSKMSERSRSAKSISPSLLPVPSGISPVQSLKKALAFKAKEKTIGVVLNKFDDYSFSRTLKKELAAEQIEKEGFRDAQAFENKEMSSGMNCNIAKEQSSMEKSCSVRTSQVSSYLPSNVSDLDLSGLEDRNISDKEKEVDFEMVDITNQCKHISELVVNKLPGYTM
uniref:Microtubule associated protein 10 n=1 Tax=Varanus komodoensis TaxID=61221 RepID=A0A8D2LUH4_VARKO